MNDFLDRFKRNEPLCRHTTFGIGGASDFFITAAANDVPFLIDGLVRRGIEYFVLGNGSNVLASDSGFRGAVIRISDKSIAHIGDGLIVCGAGALLPSISSFCAKIGLCGFEFAAGIPASAGGAVVQNASAHGCDIASVCETVFCVDFGGVLRYNKAMCGFGYRTSAFKDNGKIISACVFRLSYGSADGVYALTNQFRKQRLLSQPQGLSAGCVFKNPANASAGALIDSCGLKGKRIGGAFVSQKHANFIINDKTATAADVCALVGLVRQTVQAKCNIDLQEEIIYLGF